jgi:hypothetical protein
MIKSELIQRISSQNPHLYERHIEKIVSAILDEIVEALSRGDRVELRGFGPFQLSTEEHVQGAILVLVLPSPSQRKLFLTSSLENRCTGGLIGKPCRRTIWKPCHQTDVLTPLSGERLQSTPPWTGGT